MRVCGWPTTASFPPLLLIFSGMSSFSRFLKVRNTSRYLRQRNLNYWKGEIEGQSFPSSVSRQRKCSNNTRSLAEWRSDKNRRHTHQFPPLLLSDFSFIFPLCTQVCSFLRKTVKTKGIKRKYFMGGGPIG